MASSGGLVKVDLDTNEQEHFNRGNSKLPSNSVSEILMHPDGTLWISTSNGICTYQNEEFELSADRGSYLTLTPDNRVASLVGDAIRIYTSLHDYEEIIKPDEFKTASDLQIDSEGIFYLATSSSFVANDVITYRNGEWKIIYPIPVATVSNYLALDNNDRLWLYNYEGLKYYENETWYNVDFEFPNQGYIQRIEIDLDNNVYIYENNNDCNILHKWDGINQTVVDYRKDECQHTFFLQPSQLQSDLFYATHRINGYYTYSSTGKGNYTNISQSPLYWNQVKGSYHYSDGRVVIVTRRSIQIFNQGEWSYLPTLPDYDGHLLYSTLVNDVLWVSDTKTIWSYENEEWVALDIPTDLTSINHLAVGENGDVWVSKFSVLYRYRNSEWTKYESAEIGITTGPIEELLVQQTTNNLWVLNKFDGAVYHFDDTDWTSYELPEFLTLRNISSTPTELFIQAEQNLYSITNNQLVYIDSLPEDLFDRRPEFNTDESGKRLFISDSDLLGIYENGILNTYTVANSGMHNSYTNHISIDENNHLWLSGESGGLSVFDPSQEISSLISDNKADFSIPILIYPTFTESDFIYVEVQEAGIYSTTLTDQFGRIISQSELYLDTDKQQRIQLPSIYTGAMFITFTRNGKMQTDKIIKF